MPLKMADFEMQSQLNHSAHWRISRNVLFISIIWYLNTLCDNWFGHKWLIKSRMSIAVA